MVVWIEAEVIFALKMPEAATTCMYCGERDNRKGDPECKERNMKLFGSMALMRKELMGHIEGQKRMLKWEGESDKATTEVTKMGLAVSESLQAKREPSPLKRPELAPYRKQKRPQDSK